MKNSKFFYLLGGFSLLVDLVFLLMKRPQIAGSRYLEYFAFFLIILIFALLLAKLYDNFGNGTKKDPIFKMGLICLIILNLVNLGILFLRF